MNTKTDNNDFNLDVESWEMLTDWLSRTSPHIASVSLEQFEGDMERIIGAARVSGLSPHDARSCLPRAWVIVSGFNPHYLLKRDEAELKAIRTRREYDSLQPLPRKVVVVLAIGVLLLGVLSYGLVQQLLVIASFAFVSLLLLVAVAWSSLQDLAIEAMGPIGAAAFSRPVVNLISSGIFVLYYSSEPLLAGAMPSGIRVILLVIWGGGFILSMPSIVATMWRYQNNDMAVARLVGLSAYCEE